MWASPNVRKCTSPEPQLCEEHLNGLVDEAINSGGLCGLVRFDVAHKLSFDSLEAGDVFYPSDEDQAGFNMNNWIGSVEASCDAVAYDVEVENRLRAD